MLRSKAGEPATLSQTPPASSPVSERKQAEPLVGPQSDGQNRAGTPGADLAGHKRAVTTAAQTADDPAVNLYKTAAGTCGSRFVSSCLRRPTDRTPVWFLRQAGRYMPEYMAVRRHHSLLEICRTPDIAAEVTITAAERLGVDAAIIFADLLLPFTPMGLDFEFVADEGPVVAHPHPHPRPGPGPAHRPHRRPQLRRPGHRKSRRPLPHPPPHRNPAPHARPARHHRLLRSALHPRQLHDRRRQLPQLHRNQKADVRLRLRASRTNCHPQQSERGGVDCHPEQSEGPASFTSAPEDLTSPQGPGAPSMTASSSWVGSSNPDSTAWPLLMEKLVTVLADYAQQQVEAGADVIQVFDSWAGALSPTDYREYVLAPTTDLIRRIQAFGVPVIYFGVDTATLLPAMRETGADVLGLDWRTPLDEAWRTLELPHRRPGQPRPHHPLRPRRGPRSPRSRDPRRGRQPPRPHLQPRPRHRPRHPRRSRPPGGPPDQVDSRKPVLLTTRRRDGLRHSHGLA